jgi:hypothetical protein
MFFFSAQLSRLQWHRIDRFMNPTENESDTLYFSLSEFSKLEWKHAREFSYMGRMFDVVTVQHLEQGVMVSGHFDRKEDQLRYALQTHLTTFTGGKGTDVNIPAIHEPIWFVQWHEIKLFPPIRFLSFQWNALLYDNRTVIPEVPPPVFV